MPVRVGLNKLADFYLLHPPPPLCTEGNSGYDQKCPKNRASGLAGGLHSLDGTVN